MVYIILVNYNGLKDTLECLESLTHIEYHDYKIIVVDNGSTDNSLETLRNLENDSLIVLDAGGNTGFSGGNNVGIKYAMEHNANYVLLLNNDTIVEKNFLTPLVETAKRRNDQAVITPKILYEFDKKTIWYAGGAFNKLTSRTSSFGIHEKDSGQFDREKDVSFVSGCCMLLPASVINIVGLMEEDYFLYCEDTDYCCRIQKRGIKLVYQPTSRIYHKVSASSSKVSELMSYYIIRNKLYIVKRFIDLRWKCVAYAYVFLETVKRMISGEYSRKTTIISIYHFVKGISGKIDEL